MTSIPNPITERLELLRNQWSDFSGRPVARVLRSLIAADEAVMIDTLHRAEEEPELTELPDIFFRFDPAFPNTTDPHAPDTYGWLLRDAFLARYKADETDMRESNIPIDWKPPRHDPREHTDVEALGGRCVHYHAHHKLPGCVVLMLEPRSFASVAGFERWLQLFCQTAPDQIRVIVRDAMDKPQLNWLQENEPEAAVTMVADLEMNAAMEEISLRTTGPRTGRLRSRSHQPQLPQRNLRRSGDPHRRKEVRVQTDLVRQRRRRSRTRLAPASPPSPRDRCACFRPRKGGC
ncbi:MAG: hypothetical protein V3V08_00625 [Nannocystaceae bacterium]